MSGKFIRHTLSKVIHIQDTRFVLALLVAAASAFGQTPSFRLGTVNAADWDQLQQLHPGDKVRVELEGKPGVSGDFATVTSDSLQLVRHRKEQCDLPRTEIRRVWVYRLSKRSGTRAAAPWIGVAAGFGAGFGIGAVWAGHCEGFCVVSKPAAGAIFGVVGAGVGAVVGHLAAGKAETQTLVYRWQPTETASR